MAFPSNTTLIDAFGGANGPLPATWTAAPLGDGHAAFGITSNMAHATANVDQEAYRNDFAAGPDAEVYVTIPTLPLTGQYVELWLRLNATGNPATAQTYLLNYTQGTGIGFYKRNAGTWTQIGTTQALSLTAGDKLGFSVVGTILSAYRTTAGVWGSALYTQSDSTIAAAGRIGLTISGNTAFVDNLSGGTINIIDRLTGTIAVAVSVAADLRSEYLFQGDIVSATSLSAPGLRVGSHVTPDGFVRNLGSAVSNVAGTTLAITHAVAVPAGETIFVFLSHEYTSGGPTCTDTRGNTYTRERTSGSVGATVGPPIAGVRNSMFRCYVTTPIQVGDTTTVTLSASVTSKAMVVDQFTGLQNAIDVVNGFSGTGAGFGDSSTIVGTSFTTIAQNVVILNVLYTREAAGAALEMNPANAPLPQAGSAAATNQVRVAGGWKTVYKAGLQNFDFKLGSGVSFQIHQLSIPLVVAPVETRDYLTVANELGASALFKFTESSGAFRNAIAGTSPSASANGNITRRVNTPVASIPGGGFSVDGTAGNYIEVADHPAFSVATTGELTIAIWVRPDTLQFTLVEGEDPPGGEGHYLHYGGKAVDGSPNVYEYLFRIYNKFREDGVTLNSRPNRMSAYHFNPSGGLGAGSYFQDALVPGQWIFVAVAFNSIGPAIYRDGSWRDGDFYSDYSITPTDTATPFRLGTAVKQSWFQGAFGPIAFFPRRLADEEIFRLHQSSFGRSSSGRALMGAR